MGGRHDSDEFRMIRLKGELKPVFFSYDYYFFMSFIFTHSFLGNTNKMGDEIGGIREFVSYIYTPENQHISPEK